MNRWCKWCDSELRQTDGGAVVCDHCDEDCPNGYTATVHLSVSCDRCLKVSTRITR